MFNIHTLDDLQLLRETHELELKLAQGQSRGKLYHLPGAAPVTPEQVFPAAFSSGSSGISSGSNDASSGSNGISSPGTPTHELQSYRSAQEP